MTDFHCHILPGVDDGSTGDAESLEMARALSDAGYTTVCCTPHATTLGRYDTLADDVRRDVRRLQSLLDGAGINITLVPGMEYMLDGSLLRFLDDPLLLPGDLLLAEIPMWADSIVIDVLHELKRRGIALLIAHPERSPLLFPPEGRFSELVATVRAMFKGGGNAAQGGDQLLEMLRGFGCLFQGNLGSFTGYYGEHVRNSAGRMRALGLYHCYGSDGHSPRGVRMVLSAGADDRPPSA